MTPARWQQVKELFASAVELSPSEREVFLAQAGVDDELRHEVETLLASDAPSLMETPAVAMVAESLVSASSELSAGQFVGPYQIVQAIRGGGMGEVYLARDPRLDRFIVLKLLPPYFARDEQFVRRFAQEARAASALNHPNICIIYEIGKSIDGRDFIAMEHIAGRTLRDRIAQQPLSIAEALGVAIQVADALTAAHSTGIVHRDIKPENIMLRDDGYVKVLDFGLAKFQPRSDQESDHDARTLPKLTEPGTRMGTVQYMSPEQLCELTVDQRTDIWSLGVVLHEMVTGRTPFAAKSNNESIALILDRGPIRFAWDASVPPEFQQIVARAMSKSLEERYQKIAALAVDMKQLQGGFSVRSGAINENLPTAKLRSHPPTRLQRIKSQLTTSTRYLLGEIRRRPKLSAAALAGVALVLAFLFFPRASSLPPFQKLNFVRLTNSGRAVCAAISPDGKFVAHAILENGMQALLLTGLATNSTSTVVPAEETEYLGITFSHDGNYLYVTRRNHSSDVGALYRLALPGGTPVKLVDGVGGPITISPQGDRVSFVRFTPANGEYALMTAKIDGTDERTLARRGNGQRFSVYGSAWSPDGETIVCAAGRWENGYRMNLVGVGVADGKERTLGTQQWFSILQVSWLADKGWLMVSARERWTSPYQLWRVSYPQGEVVRVSNDTVEHESVSLARDGKAMVSVQSQQVGRLWIAPGGDDRQARVIASNVGRIYGLNWTPDGKLVFSTMGGNNLNISLFDPDSSKQTQLTTNAGDNYNPAPSPDGQYIAFASNRTGSLNIWQMKALDGSEPRQLTFSDGNSYPAYSRDGHWVAYDNQSAPNTTIWKVAIDGSAPLKISDNGRMPVISPDNQFIAYRYRGEIAIMPVQGGEPIRRLPIPVMEWQQVQWTADSHALMYVMTVDGTSNIWSYDLATGSTKQLTNFIADKIFAYAWSADYTKLACQRGGELADVILISDQP
ncbi:MAG TPA: protein kinase [Pyrinomonadaceae bacterium]|nr:protein kinase [Pyrinomonadaceae bacterium]